MRSFVIFGLRPPLWPRLRGGDEPGQGVLADQPGFVFGHQGKHAEDEFAVGGGGVDDPVGQRLHPDPAAFEGGDDVDEVAQVRPIRSIFQMIRVSPDWLV